MNDVRLLAHLLTMAGADPTHAREQSHALLAEHHSLGAVLALPRERLLGHTELGEGCAAFLLLIAALLARYVSPPFQPAICLGDQAELERLLQPRFSGQETERLYAFCLDQDLNLISSTLAAQGGQIAVSCSLGRVLDLALSHRAKGVILAHNHPDGVPFFSKSDLLSTSILFQELLLVDIPLLDHYLLAGEQIVSLRQLALEQKLPAFSFPLPEEWFPPPEKPKT